MREKYSLMNMTAGLVGQLAITLLSFAQRMIFIRCLSMEYLGVNGLFSNILSVLGIAELGIGPAMLYSMYKPAAEGNQAHVARLMNLYRRLYRCVALVVAGLGLAILPFLEFFVKEGMELPNLRVIYLLYLASTVSNYFLGYKNAILLAHQRAYYRNAVEYIGRMVQLTAQTIVLLCTQNFILYLLIQLFSQLTVNLLVARKADRDYPYLKSNRELPNREEGRSIAKNVRAMGIHTIGATIKNGTDNILISAYVGLSSVGIYSNYQMIYLAASSLMRKIYEGFSTSIGNLGATESGEKVYEVFQKLDFFVFLLYGYVSVGMFVMCSPLIELIFGAEYLFPTQVVCLLTLDFYLTGVRQITLEFRTALGLFWRDRYKAAAESAINLFVSLLLVQRYGVEGVLLGTVISTVSTCSWVEPYIFMRYGIKDDWKRRLRDHFVNLFIRIFSVAAAAGISYAICQNVGGGGIGWFLAKCLICTAVYAVVAVALFSRCEEFKYLKDYAIQLLTRYRFKL